MEEEPGSSGSSEQITDWEKFMRECFSQQNETTERPPAKNRASANSTEQNETPLGKPSQSVKPRGKRRGTPEKHKLVQQQEEKKPSKAKPVKAKPVEGRKLRSIPLSAIDLDKNLETSVTDFGGQFDVDLNFLTKLGCSYLTDILRIHVVPQGGRYRCVAGFLAQQVLANHKDRPSHVVVDVHELKEKDKNKAKSKEDIDRWLAMEFQFLPPLFWWKHKHQEDDEVTPSLFDKNKSKVDKKLEVFANKFNAACKSDACGPLVHRPLKKDLHRVFRIAPRTADKLPWPER